MPSSLLLPPFPSIHLKRVWWLYVRVNIIVIIHTAPPPRAHIWSGGVWWRKTSRSFALLGGEGGPLSRSVLLVEEEDLARSVGLHGFGYAWLVGAFSVRRGGGMVVADGCPIEERNDRSL